VDTYFTIIENFITTWGYLAVAVGMALESACFPVPSEIVLPFAGFLVYQGKLTFLEAVTAGLIGGMVGSISAYTVGRLGGRPFILKHRRRLLFFIHEKDLSRADRWVARYGDHAAFWARFLPIVRTFISLPLGMAKMPFGRFVAYSLVGSIPWTVALVWAGRELGENWSEIAVYGDWVNLGLIVLLVVLVVYFGRKLRRVSRSDRNVGEE